MAAAATVRWWVMRTGVLGREREEGDETDALNEAAVRALGPLAADDPQVLSLLRER